RREPRRQRDSAGADADERQVREGAASLGDLVGHAVDHPANAVRVQDPRLFDQSGGQVPASLWPAPSGVNDIRRMISPDSRSVRFASKLQFDEAMVLYNSATKELTAKVVYYGPGFCGKTTNLQLLHDRLDPKTVGNLVNLSTQTDRTIYFDLLPVELGEIKGYRIRFQLATVPGQTAFNETRKVVLKGADGIVFVADSRWASLPKNQESWQNLKDNLKANDLSFETIPIVIQYNKRDLDDILSVEAMQEALGFASYPSVEAVASAGRGITETFKLISKLTFVDLLRRFQGRKPQEGAPPPRPPPPREGAAPPPTPPAPPRREREKRRQQRPRRR